MALDSEEERFNKEAKSLNESFENSTIHLLKFIFKKNHKSIKTQINSVNLIFGVGDFWERKLAYKASFNFFNNLFLTIISAMMKL